MKASLLYHGCISQARTVCSLFSKQALRNWKMADSRIDRNSKSCRILKSWYGALKVKGHIRFVLKLTRPQEELDLNALASEANRAMAQPTNMLNPQVPDVTVIVKVPVIAMKYPMNNGQVMKARY